MTATVTPLRDLPTHLRVVRWSSCVVCGCRCAGRVCSDECADVLHGDGPEAA